MLPILLAVLFFPTIQCGFDKELTKVEFHNISHSVLNSSYFKNYNPDLAFLKISSSRIGKIDRNAFEDLTNLNFLDLSGTHIENEIDSDTFADIRSLEKLVLRNISLHHVNLNLSNVQELILSGNLIEKLDGDDIIGENVNYLDISNNKIKYLNSSLGSLKHLSTIDISDNLIENISPDVFKNNTNLIRIRAYLNNITSMAGLNLPRLKYLSLSLNKIGYLTAKTFDKMKFLEELDLVYNFITHIEKDSFKDLFELRFLDLSGNLITYINPMLFRNNLYLTRLSINFNKLTALQRFFGHFHHLSVLSFADNKLSYIDSDFFLSMPNIETLDLRKNNLKYISGLFTSLKNLKVLYLQENQIFAIGDELKGNINLKFLNISSNGLNLGLSNFKNNKKLIHLDLSDNSISNFCDANVALENLMKINLQQNNITDLSCLGRNFSSLCELNLRNNLLECGKNLDDLMTSLVHKKCSLYQRYPEKLDYIVYSFFEIQMGIPHYQCNIISLNQSLNLWNTIRNEMCPNTESLTTKVLKNSYNEEIDSLKADVVEIFTMSKEKILSDSKRKNEEENSSEKSSSEKIIQVVTLKPQSERVSWEKIDKDADFVDTLEEQEENEVGNYAWYTVPVILIVLTLGLTVFNVAVFLYIRFKVWRTFNSRREKQYTFLKNEVYRNTTEPNNFNQLYKSQMDGNLNNKIFSFDRINELFLNFGLKKEKDSESTKNILINSSHNLNI